MATIVARKAPPCAPARSEALRVWLFRTFFTSLAGVTWTDWWHVLRENGFAVDPAYWPRAFVLTAGSALNSLYRRKEDRAYGSLLERVEIPPPLFILGHWRSGTTLLHNLLALDDRFAYPNLYEVFFPHTFLCTEDVRAGQVTSLVPSTRVMDNVPQGVEMPNEDEFATCAASLASPYMFWAFPRRQEQYEKYLTFRDVPEAEVARWKDEFLRFARKLTLRHHRPLLLKSPPHTGRIKLLLELFPDARFVSIHRDPYTVFQSTKHLNATLTRSLQFQHPGDANPDDAVIRRYRLMHEAFFAERTLIPEGHFHEMAFDELESDPLGAIRRTYEHLGLPGIDDVLPAVEDYVRAQSGYRKNAYSEVTPDQRRRIQREWRRSFEAWDYAM
ncbi:MAG: sulfotransferase [Isosphaeraceae bacterium]|nr:sulfotransferase [Isosphaeraceae bacterium]